MTPVSFTGSDDGHVTFRAAPSGATITTRDTAASFNEGGEALAIGTPPRTVIVNSGTGPRGERGADGGGTFQLEAATAIGGHRAIVTDADGLAVYADNQTAAHQYGALGVTTGAASAGDSLSIVALGAITEASWSWTPQQPVFVGAAGVLTQTPPAAPAWLRVVGVAISPTTLFVRPDPPIHQT